VQSTFLSGQLAVFRNIDYFRRFFAATFMPKNSIVPERKMYMMYPDGKRFECFSSSFLCSLSSEGLGMSGMESGMRFGILQLHF
jgi:hypothetical protein